MADNTPQNGTNKVATDEVTVGGELAHVQLIHNYDPELGLPWGTTTLRDRLVAQRYTVLADSIADGMNAFWVSTLANGGTVASTAGEGLVQTSANAAGSAQIVSPAPAYHPGQVAWLNSAIRLGDTGSAGNVRRWGAFTVSGGVPQDGFAYELDGTTLNAVTYKAGVATKVAVGSWSRFTDAPFTLTTNYHQFEIRWTANRADFYVDNLLRHTASGGASSLTTTLNFPMAIQNVNSSGATNRLIAVRNIGLGRFGSPDVVRDATDLGRVIRNFSIDAYTAAPAAEALQNVVQYYNNAAVAATTQPAVVPAGKVFRLSGMRLSTKALATFGSAVLRIRANPAGLVVIGSPFTGVSLEAGGRAGATTVSATGHLDHAEITFPEGIDFPAGTGLGFTLAGYGPAGAAALQGVTRFDVWGYEYTAS